MYIRLGPFLFSVPTYSVETMRRTVSSRVAANEVIGAKPITHLLGPAAETISMTSTFYPFHLNTGGIQQLEAVRAASKAQLPLMLVTAVGLVLNRWIITSVESTESAFGVLGSAEKYEVEMTLAEYVDRNQSLMGF